MEKVFAVILAAGASTRLGFNKLTVVVDGESVIRRSVKPFLIEEIHRVLVITGHNSRDVTKELEGLLRVDVIHNPHYTQGMSTSVKAALPSLGDADAVLFHLGDKPFVTARSIKAILTAYRETRARIVAPFHNGKMGHPVLIDANMLRAESGMLLGDSGLREVIEKYRRDVVFIDGDEGNLWDIDTVQAIDRLRERGYRIEEGKR